MVGNLVQEFRTS